MKPAQRAASAEEEVAELREQLELAQRHLAETYKMASLGNLIAGIVHEINTPIGAIRSNNEVICRSLEKVAGAMANHPELEKARTILESCRTLVSVDRIACDRISAVIRGLKTFARGSSDEFRKVNLHDAIENTLKLTQCEFRRRVNVETDFGDLPEVECYPDMMNQVFLNILINAGQAIENEGTVRVETRRENDCVRISISDTGRGISPSDLSRIFDAGFTTKPPGVGTGLGLSICRQIVVKKHGGAIEAESVPGTGTIFHIRIPIGQKHRGAC